MQTAEGVITKPSPYSVEETLQRLTAIFEEKSITVFALIDHSGEAEKVGIEMPPTKVLIFGNPKGGTGAMLEAPLSAIDLPLKALVWGDTEGNVSISYNDPQFLQQRFGLSDAAMKPISGIGNLIDMAIA
jgi:uncharacterized protein (DUF302 family)